MGPYFTNTNNEWCLRTGDAMRKSVKGNPIRVILRTKIEELS